MKEKTLFVLKFFVFKKRPNSIQRWYVQYYIQFSVYLHTSNFNSAAKELILITDTPRPCKVKHVLVK